MAWLIAAAAAGEAAARPAARRRADRTREETAQRRADEERLHIARELHDSLTHQISVIKLQSEVAVHVARRRGEEVPSRCWRSRRRDVRRAGSCARPSRPCATATATRTGSTTSPSSWTAPRASGLDATLTIGGEHTDVPSAVGRTVYRIVQESLTNVARHATSATASVRIDWRPDALAVRIDDDPATTGVTSVPGWDCSGCANESPPSAAACGRSRARRAASGSRPSYPWTSRHDPRPAGRRPARDPQRVSGLLELEDDIEVVAEAADGNEGLALGQGALTGPRPHRHPDAGRRWHRGDPAHRSGPDLDRVHVVILTNYGLDEYVFNALRAGAAGFLVKDILPEDFLHAVRVAARGDACSHPRSPAS